MIKPVVVIDGRRRWHEVLLFLLSIVYGIAFLGGAPKPGSVIATVPRWEVYGWAALLLASGATGLPGSLMTAQPRWGLPLELAGLSLGAGALLMYDACLISLGVPSVAFTVGVATVWMCSNILRGLQVLRDLRRLP